MKLICNKSPFFSLVKIFIHKKHKDSKSDLSSRRQYGADLAAACPNVYMRINPLSQFLHFLPSLSINSTDARTNMYLNKTSLGCARQIYSTCDKLMNFNNKVRNQYFLVPATFQIREIKLKMTSICFLLFREKNSEKKNLK